MPPPTKPIVRYVTVTVRPSYLRRFDGPTYMSAEIAVQTQYDKYTLDEHIPEDDFTRRFDWLNDRAKREIESQILKPAVE